MLRRFETERFDLVNANSIRIADHRFGHNHHGELDVWIETSEKGERFSSQISVNGQSYPVRREIYTGKCYILREKRTNRYFFLDRNDSGFWLHSDAFFGAETFSADESTQIGKWLTGFAN